MSDFDRRRNAERRTGTDRRSGRDRRVSQETVDVERRKAERRTRQRRSGRDRRNEADWQPIPLDAVESDDSDPESGLIAAATDARRHARARYSGFLVGAALETDDGHVITGCNIENATYGLTLCAERVALVKALSDGHAVFTRLAVIADTPTPTPPCGTCRQILWEYCGDIEVIIANLDGACVCYRLADLLPLPFDSRLLE